MRGPLAPHGPASTLGYSRYARLWLNTHLRRVGGLSLTIIPAPAFLPKRARNYQRIHLLLLPPLAFSRGVVNVTVMCGTQRHCELITDLQTQSPSLCIAHVMG